MALTSQLTRFLITFKRMAASQDLYDPSQVFDTESDEHMAKIAHDEYITGLALAALRENGLVDWYVPNFWWIKLIAYKYADSSCCSWIWLCATKAFSTLKMCNNTLRATIECVLKIGNSSSYGLFRTKSIGWHVVKYMRAHAYALYISLHTRSSNVYNADGSLVEDQSFSAFEALISSINMVYSTAPITVNIIWNTYTCLKQL